MKEALTCPSCGAEVTRYRNPFPTVDIIIELGGREQAGPVVLVWRANQPVGWALPGGFVDYGESVEQAAVREAKEETGLEVELLALLGVYSRPGRDPRNHTQTTVFCARAQGQPEAGDDAARLDVFPPGEPPAPMCFDHADILRDYCQWRAGLRPGAPIAS